MTSSWANYCQYGMNFQLTWLTVQDFITYMYHCTLPVHDIYREDCNCSVCLNIGRTWTNDADQTQKPILYTSIT